MKPKSGVLANHQKYTFYLWVGASGGSKAMFGPFYLDVGCTSTSVNLQQSGSFSTSGNNKWVGDSTANAYTLVIPVLSPARSWCVHTNSVPVEVSDGTTPAAMMAVPSSQPATVFALANTIMPQTVTFKILSTFTNGHQFLSSAVSLTISCGNMYTMSEVAPVTNPQIKAHGGSEGFILPVYQSTQNAGCPPISWTIVNMIPAGSLNQWAASGSDKIVRPTNNALHQQYQFKV